MSNERLSLVDDRVVNMTFNNGQSRRRRVWLWTKTHKDQITLGVVAVTIGACTVVVTKATARAAEQAAENRRVVVAALNDYVEGRAQNKV